jgi:D-3-phosphoglycerate dehydrogenase
LSKRALVISRSFGECPVGAEVLYAAGVETVVPPGGPALSRDGLRAAIADVDCAIIGTQRFDGDLLDPAGRLRAIVKAGTGLDNVDLAAAEAAGISVSAVPGANASAVAEYAMALMLSAARRTCEVDRSVRAGKWGRFKGADLSGATVGIVGLGNVGRALCRLLSGFGVTLLGYDVVADEAFNREAGVTLATVDEIAARSDFVTLHAPLTDDTFHLFERRRIALMKPSAILVNAARGELVDTEALYEALLNHAIAGAALDVFEAEPFSDERFFALENIVLSSHNAAYSVRGLKRTVVAAAEKALDLLGLAQP